MFYAHLSGSLIGCQWITCYVLCSPEWIPGRLTVEQLLCFMLTGADQWISCYVLCSPEWIPNRLTVDHLLCFINT